MMDMERIGYGMNWNAGLGNTLKMTNMSYERDFALMMTLFTIMKALFLNYSCMNCSTGWDFL